MFGKGGESTPQHPNENPGLETDLRAQLEATRAEQRAKAADAQKDKLEELDRITGPNKVVKPEDRNTR